MISQLFKDKQISAVKIPALSGSTEYPSDKDIVAALAGELLSACIRVSTSDYGAKLQQNIAFDANELVVVFYGVGMGPIYRFAKIEADDAAERIADLIKRVEAIGEVSA